MRATRREVFYAYKDGVIQARLLAFFGISWYIIETSYMRTRVHVEKTQNENNASVLRRFTRKMQSTGILMKLRKHRYNERPLSPATKKHKTLTRLARSAHWNELYKLGKVSKEKQKRK